MTTTELIELDSDTETIEKIDEEIKSFRNEYKKILKGQIKYSISYRCGQFMTEIFNTFSCILLEIKTAQSVIDVHELIKSLMKSREFLRLRQDFFEGLQFKTMNELWDNQTDFFTEMDGTIEEFTNIENKLIKCLRWAEEETMTHIEMALTVSVNLHTPLKFLDSYKFPYKITLKSSKYLS